MSSPVILVVDDQEHIRKLAAVTLEMCGYRTLIARDGVEALKHLEKQHVDLLLTDWAMPQMNGRELVAHVENHFKEIPIVVFSCSSESLTQTECRDLGIQGWIKKPFRIKILQNTITKIFDETQEA